MAILDPLIPKVLATRIIPRVDPALARAYGFDSRQDAVSLGLITCDMDDALYAALDEAAKTAGSGATSIMARQREMVQQALDEISAMADTMKSGGDPAAMMTAQADFAKRSFEMAIKNTSEIAGLAQKSSTDAFKVLQKNMQETLEDVRTAMTRQTKK